MVVEHCSCTPIGCVKGVVLKLLDQALLSRNSQVCLPFVGDSLFSSGIGPRTSEAILVILMGAKSKLYLAYTDDFSLPSLMSSAAGSSCRFLNSLLPWYLKLSNTWAKPWRLCSVVFSSLLPVLAETLSLHSRRISSALPSFASRSLIKYNSFFIISIRNVLLSPSDCLRHTSWSSFNWSLMLSEIDAPVSLATSWKPRCKSSPVSRVIAEVMSLVPCFLVPSFFIPTFVDCSVFSLYMYWK